MNYGTTTLAILVALSASFALAEDFKTVQGKEYKNVWVAAAEREDAGRFIVRADEKLTAFLELESATGKNTCEHF